MQSFGVARRSGLLRRRWIIAVAAALAACSRTSSESLCVLDTEVTPGLSHTRMKCPYSALYRDEPLVPDVALTVGSGGGGVAYAFIDRGEAGRALFRMDGATHVVIDVSPVMTARDDGKYRESSFATDGEGGVHICDSPGRAGDLERGSLDYGEYVAGSWKVETLVGPSRTNLSCTLSGGPGRYVLFGKEGVVLRRDKAGQIDAFSLPTGGYRSAALLDSRLVPRLVRAGGSGAVVSSALSDEPDVLAIRNFRFPQGVAAARIPGVVLPAIVVQGVEDGIRVAYPTGSGYVEIPVPNTAFGGRDRCFRCIYYDCLDLCENASEPTLAAASGALWLAWIHDVSNRSYSCVGSKHCSKTLETDHGHTELVLARVTESGVDVRKRLPVASQRTHVPTLGMRAIDQHLVIGVVTQSANPEVFVVDASKL